METLIQLILSAMAVFMILLVLVQRGRGGGLAGALGGPGGSSAFGAKAGDTFTRITVWAAAIWIITCVLCAYWANNRGDSFGDSEINLATGTSQSDGGDSGASTSGAATADADSEDSPAAETTTDAPAETSGTGEDGSTTPDDQPASE
ncbi:preprotein translocase subunit SecG [Botrimarina hoheduenensis]|uniref:Protein-export membrane protein SecG n=1 Tax=Botrimarina hoheduenensis TaxID=2528000 RepID=A0A5C5WA52_9BACT|nr:preprotein translocase subunit SecG [Botrimarina hoheduenensis]TWT47758.1 preprotein translocase subunit SecG [Botrimarina hoheduenensis]